MSSRTEEVSVPDLLAGGGSVGGRSRDGYTRSVESIVGSLSSSNTRTDK